MPMAQRILAQSTGSSNVEEGDILEVGLDAIFVHEALGKVITKLEELEAHGARIKEPEKIFIVLDHWCPAPNVGSAINHKVIRAFARRHGLEHFFDVGRHGICHQLIAEEGFVLPGNILIGSDSHTPTLGALGAFAIGVGPTDIIGALVNGRTWLKVPSSIEVKVDGETCPGVGPKDVALKVLDVMGHGGAEGRALEFHGKAIREMGMSGRFTIANMSVETGATTCIIPPDRTTGAFLKRSRKRFFMTPLKAEGNYESDLEIDASELEPLVATPPDPGCIRTVKEMEGIVLDQVYIGSCTNGRLEDLEVAEGFLRGKRVHPRTRLIVSPVSQKVFLGAMRKGFIASLVRAGAIVTSPGCNACFGGHMGILAKDESCLSTTNRNFPGRMGSKDATIYLASPATAAVSALKGEIADPRDY